MELEDAWEADLRGVASTELTHCLCTHLFRLSASPEELALLVDRAGPR